LLTAENLFFVIFLWLFYEIVTKTQEGFLRHSEAGVRRPRRTRLGSSTDPTKKGAQSPPRCINQERLTTKKIAKKPQGNSIFNCDCFRRSG